MPLVPAWIRRGRSSASGVGVSTPTDYPVSKISRAAADRRVFPPSVMVEIKALACELPSRRGLPLARWSLAELRREAVAQGLVAQISGTTLWRWLSQDALRLRRQSRPHLGPLSVPLAGQSPGATRLCAMRRREDQHPSAPAQTSLAAAWTRTTDLHRARIRTRRRLGIHRRLGRASRQVVRPLRAQDRHRPLRAPGRSGHAQTTVPIRPPRILDRRQWLRSSRPTRRRPPPRQVAQYHPRPHPGARQLAQPDRGVLLHCPTQAPDA